MSTKIARIAGVLVTMAVIGITLPGSHALAMTNHSTFVALFTADNCWVIVAKLNGNQPSTTACLLARTPTDGGVRPDIGKVGCDNSGTSPQLQLYADANYMGTELCLFGQGADDLSVWSFDNTMTSWNDPNVHNAPSGKVYKGSGETGDAFVYGPAGHSQNVGSGWNDQASSVCISPGCV